MGTLVSAHGFGDVSSCEVGGSKGKPGASAAILGGSRCHGASWREAERRALKNGSDKRASGVERVGNHRPYIYCMTVSHSKAQLARQAAPYPDVATATACGADSSESCIRSGYDATCGADT